MAAVPAEWQLKPHPTIPQGLPVLVCILDGWGENEVKDEFNATHAAATPHVDALRALGPSRWRTVKAHGPAVGLPTWDDMGNSEVGHNALGAGQLIDQGARLVDRALADGSLFQHGGWKYISAAFEAHTVHFIGLLSSGGVHSRANQLHQRACFTVTPCVGAVSHAPPLFSLVFVLARDVLGRRRWWTGRGCVHFMSNWL